MLSAHEQLTRQLRWVQEILKDAESCPRLTDWERNFVANIQEGIGRLGILARFSDRQMAILRQIEEKIYAH
jgi:hypothetical protein